MRTVGELRQALIEETSELETRVDLPAVRRRARRRRLGRAAGAGVAGLTGVAVAAYAATGAGPGPGPGITRPMGPALPTPSISLQVHPSFPTTGQVIRTGAPIGGPDRELVLRFVGVGDDTRLVGGLLDRRTGVVRDLEGGAGMTRATAPTGRIREVDPGDGRARGGGRQMPFLGPARPVKTPI